MSANYKNIPTSSLVDLLSQHTQRFTQLLTEKKFTEEYRECKDIIQQILSEIEYRKMKTVKEDQGLQTKQSDTRL